MAKAKKAEQGKSAEAPNAALPRAWKSAEAPRQSC
jgi:hypothetical protein